MLAPGGGGGFQSARLTVAGRPAAYGQSGDGPPILFLPAWSLTFRPYQRCLGQLTAAGYRVIVPSLPGSGGSAECPSAERDFVGHAAWVAAFLDELATRDPALGEPMVVAGHGFGAGVAVQLAHDYPSRVGQLVLMDTVGLSMGTPRPLRQLLGSKRPPGSWMSDVWKQLLPFPEALLNMQAAAGEVMFSAATNGWGALQRAQMVGAADLTGEMATLRARGMPILCFTNDEDMLMPQRCVQAMTAALGPRTGPLAGEPGWVRAEPSVEASLVRRVGARTRSRQAGDRPAAPTHRSLSAELAELAAVSDLPLERATELAATASARWLLSDSVDALAADIALCHPPPAGGEVRASVQLLADSCRVRLTVVAEDRPGLLADSAAVVTAAGCSVVSASACTWVSHNLALHTLIIDPQTELTPARWDDLSQNLRDLNHRQPIEPSFRPIGLATVTINGSAASRAAPSLLDLRESAGKTAVRHKVSAAGSVATISDLPDTATISDTVVEIWTPDTPGLLWATCRWFAEHDLSITSATVSTQHGIAEGAFIVHGPCDGAALARHLSPPER